MSLGEVAQVCWEFPVASLHIYQGSTDEICRMSANNCLLLSLSGDGPVPPEILRSFSWIFSFHFRNCQGCQTFFKGERELSKLVEEDFIHVTVEQARFLQMLLKSGCPYL